MASAFRISPKPQKQAKRPTHSPRKQHGVGLVELMVGVAIGLLTVAMSIASLMVARGVSSSVSDASELQQQAAYAFRIIGQQLRQAGSLRLNMAPQQAPGSTMAIDSAAPVAFETGGGFDPAIDTLSGMDSPGSGEFQLTVGYRNYTESVHTSASDESLQRNCLGETNSDTLIQSRFTLDSSQNTLRCAGSGAAQPVADNIANFRVRYLLQDATLTPGNPQIKYANATTVGSDWRRVQGVEICLVRYGTEAIDMPAGSSYTDCDGSTVDMTTLTGARTRRMHIVFRNVYQLRSQGLI
ncbi:hypothetical protein AwPolaro_07010 [Polaromonas sp.]|nr:hypothetical protein AwPolaro_07010 [Polaromonas sp.]